MAIRPVRLNAPSLSLDVALCLAAFTPRQDALNPFLQPTFRVTSTRTEIPSLRFFNLNGFALDGTLPASG
jgi:hypothetical protein